MNVKCETMLTNMTVSCKDKNKIHGFHGNLQDKGDFCVRVGSVVVVFFYQTRLESFEDLD